MQTQMTLLFFAIPLVLTLLKLRTAWLWLSVVGLVVLVWALFQYANWSMTQGNMPWLLKRLLFGGSSERSFHSTYYIVAHYRDFLTLSVPAFIVGLLKFIPQHPRRTPVDVFLFWLAMALFVASKIVVPAVLRQQGMPRRYVEYPESIAIAGTVSSVLAIACFAVVIWAALRPIISWARAGKS